MIRLLSMLLALCLLFGPSALALTEAERSALAAPYLPADAVFVAEKTDDGMTELKYRTADNAAEYELKLDADGGVVKVSYDLRGDRGGARQALSQAEAEAIVTSAREGAVITAARLEKDDGLYEYELEFSSHTMSGKYTLNAENGVVMEYELYPAIDGAYARDIIAAAYPGASVNYAEKDMDDGREVYEGEASYQNRVYEFEIDIATGRVTKWEHDD